MGEDIRCRTINPYREFGQEEFPNCWAAARRVIFAMTDGAVQLPEAPAAALAAIDELAYPIDPKVSGLCGGDVVMMTNEHGRPHVGVMGDAARVLHWKADARLGDGKGGRVVIDTVGTLRRAEQITGFVRLKALKATIEARLELAGRRISTERAESTEGR